MTPNTAVSDVVTPSKVQTNILISLKKAARLILVNTAQDFVWGKMYYGVIPDEEAQLVTSDREMIELSRVRSRDIILTTKNVMRNRFSAQGIARFLESGASKSAAELYAQISQYIKRFVVLPGEEYYSLLALWVMGTYIFRIFRCYPYIHLNAEKGSGKSLLLEVLGPICFNGSISVNSTAAVIFHEVQDFSATLLMDEFEQFGSGDREAKAAMMEVLKSGHTKSGTVKRCGGAEYELIRTYSTYSPKIFAGIGSIDEVLRDRTIPMPIVRKLPGESVEVYTGSQAIEDLQSLIRDDSYIWGLENGPSIGVRYGEGIERVEGMNELQNRQRDLWKPIFMIANTVDGSNGPMPLTQSMKVLADRCQNRRMHDDELENDTTSLLVALNRLVNDQSPDRIEEDIPFFECSRVRDFLRQEGLSYSSPKALTVKLRAFDVVVKTCKFDGSSKRAYGFDLDKLDESYLRYVDEP